MRVIAGIYGGRTFMSPHGQTTHPMSERMRGALFGALGDISNLRVLDAYGGSGALAIEAISRGAAMAESIDNDQRAARTMRENKTALGIGDVWHIVQQTVYGWSEQSDMQFDIVLCDPPYEGVRADHLERLAAHCKNVLVLSLPKNTERPTFVGFQIERDKSYADGSLVFYVKN